MSVSSQAGGVSSDYVVNAVSDPLESAPGEVTAGGP